MTKRMEMGLRFRTKIIILFRIKTRSKIKIRV